MKFYIWRRYLVFGIISLLVLYAVVRGGGGTQADKPVVLTAAEIKAQPPNNFVLLITGNWLGQLEPCGCADKQLGGIDRRSHILFAVPEPARLLVDAGPLIEDDGRQSQLKFETFLYCLKHLKYDSISMTGEELLIKDEVKLEEHPPLVVTNMSEQERETFGASAYLKKTLVVGEHQLDCVVLSLARELKSGSKQQIEKLQLQESVQSVKNTLEGLSISPDKPSGDKLVVVTMAEHNKGLAEELQKIEAIDVIATVDSLDEPERCVAASGPVIVSTGRLGKYIVRIDVPFDYAGNSKDLQFKRIAVEEEFPRDKAIIERINEYQQQMEMEALIEEAKFALEPLENGNSFVGNSACGVSGCHQEIYEKWREFRHGHALKTLEDVSRQYDPSCVSCHTVGMAYETGYRSRGKTPDLADVGCEMCHGPGQNHIFDEYEDYQIIFTTCEQCHDHESSPQFESKRDEYFQKIQHWSEPRKYWE